jgi:anti-sigma B factor antagonist
MAFSTRTTDHAVVFQISGKFLGSIDGPAFKEELERIKGAGQTNVIVNLAKADFLDSSAIGLLIGSLTSMRKVDGDVKLCGMKNRVKNLFLLTRLLGPVFVEYDSVAEAEKSFS